MLLRAAVTLVAPAIIIGLWIVLLVHRGRSPFRIHRSWYRLILAITLGLSATAAAFSSALFVDTVAEANNRFTTIRLAAPTSVTATVTGDTVRVSWGTTSSSRAVGYRVYRATQPGGPYTQIAQVSSRWTTSHTDTPGVGTFYYVVLSYYDTGGANWYSANSNEATASVLQPHVFASTTGNTGTNCRAAPAMRDLRQGYVPTDPEETFTRGGAAETITFCTSAFTAGQVLPAGTTTVSAYFSSTANGPCVVTATLYHNGVTSLGTADTIVHNSQPLRLNTFSFATTGVTFAAGDRLNLHLAWQPFSVCNKATLHFDGTSTASSVTLPKVTGP